MSAYNTFGDIVRINVNLLVATICGASAFFIWPTTIEFWGLGFLSILLVISSFKLLIRAIALMRKLKLFAEYSKRAQPKSATLANAEALRKAGMK